MGRTRSTSRSVSSTRSVPYDLDLPENKTVSQLKDDLTKRGIDFPANARKTQLIKLWKNYVIRMTAPVHIPETDSPTDSNRHDTLPDVNATLVTSPSGPSQGSPDLEDVHKHGDLHHVHATMSTMASTMERLVNKVAELEKKQLNPQALIIPQSNAPYIIPQHSQGRYTLETAMSQPVAAASVPNVNTRPANMINVTNDNVPVGMNDAAPLGLPVTAVHSGSVGPLNQGYSSESLPHVELVSPMIRKKILEGKNVNLAVLLIPHYEGVMTNEERSDLYSCSTKKPDHRLNKILDLSSFMKAFGIYKSVMTEVYPQRQKELDLYERNIIDMGTRYPGSGFYEYHRQFSAKAAAYLEQHNIKIDWSIRDNILYTNIFTGQQASSCRLCHSLSHDTSFCPQTLHERYSRFDSKQVDKTSDMRGRAKQFFNGQEICNNYNGPKGCIRDRCNYSHVCLSCHNSHPQRKCPELMSSKKMTESKNVQAPRNRTTK